ncbi:MAG: ribonuclease III [Mycoplasmoidaceae bacterium]|nr:ribonuclease III [Mycoplasmoidaceae bacterium]
MKEVLGLNPKNLSIYVEALTHRSYANEHNQNYSYQRLEYLGDSVLGFLTADYLYKKYPKKHEGELTVYRKRLVQSNTETAIAKQLGMQNYVLLGVGASKSTGIDKILEDCFESLLGAIYLDSGIEPIKKLLNRTLFKFDDEAILNAALDYKTLVQEALMKHNTKNAMYHTKQLGPNNFEAVLKVGNITYGKGKGQNKKQAEKAAAKEAYSKLVKEGK